ncbi:hypothetical protein [Nonomuraea rubra]
MGDASSWNGEMDALRRAGCPARAIGKPLRNLDDDAATVGLPENRLPG